MAHSFDNVQQLVGHLFRLEAGKMAAVLTRYLGTENFELAEDLVQDTLMKAMEVWPFHGIPQNPSAWLYQVAKNKAVDSIRTNQREAIKRNSYQQDRVYSIHTIFDEEEINDSVLRMMFTCCHPSIPLESQIALTLKTLGGLSTQEIAQAFLTNEDTIAKRIYRAKEKLREEGIQLVSPNVFDLSFRLNSVLKVLYLLFNEGYYSQQSDVLIREDLCEEAMRITYLLIQHPATNLPKVKALLSLMCLQVSRIDARTSLGGEIILLEDQDRSKWNQPLIEKGMRLLEEASVANELSEYHVEAAIASVHALSNRFEDTQWKKLVLFYEMLQEIKPGPMIDLNRAIAVGYAESPERGIEELNRIKNLNGHYLHLCAIGNFYLVQRNITQAKDYFERALLTTNSSQEVELIKRYVTRCS